MLLYVWVLNCHYYILKEGVNISLNNMFSRLGVAGKGQETTIA